MFKNGQSDPQMSKSQLLPGANPIKLFFIANEEFFRFSLVSLSVCYM